jgi:glucokinase
MKVAIGIDLGGTTVKGVILDESGKIIMQHYLPTNETNTNNWQNTPLEMVQYLKNKYPKPIELIGLSAPGLANEANNCIAHLPNRLPGLENFVWENYFQTKTFVLNDAHAALMAEAKFGAIKNYKNAVLLTLGTGVGGGILINGELYQGLSQMAGHLGHLSINFSDDEPSILGMPGSLEYAFGNYSISRRSVGKYTSTKELLEAYANHEPVASWLWLDSVRKLAIAICSIINALSPEIIVLSGGITLANQLLFNPLQNFIDLYEFSPKGKKTVIKKAEFSDFSGAIGAAAFAFSKNQ